MSSLPHMLPSVFKLIQKSEFSSHAQALGLTNDDHIVVYDQGMFSAPRVWWTFRVFGHDRVSVLDGGLKKWIKEGLPVTDKVPEQVNSSGFSTQFQQGMVADYDAIIKNLSDFTQPDAFTLVDARSAGRFSGEGFFSD
jgi:thiosulfate/3-mercaptopyruvate sulfurtransferase